MPRKSTRTADPAALTELLWSPATSVGRSGVTLAAITAAGVRIGDEERLDGVTMRRVAEAVGVAPMTLYSYVPGRPELLELMLDSVAATTYAGRPKPRDKPDWRAAMEYVSERNWEHALAHPWTVEAPPGRPILGPGVCLKYEDELAAVDGIGLTDQEMDHLITTVIGISASAARWRISLDRIRANSALTDDEWWRLSEPVLSESARGLDLHISTRVGESMSSVGEPHVSMRFGLACLLDGVAKRIAR
ncbi:TetR family transcriptional regulator [Antricoccus suffuscus]|uniref:TetR family transcriptional regulator n=1 Tax=Antricoccus suffuscus TaxID=1629062 RepID=A0A2T0ZWN2_9ACTN|nr:TetR/AcrR family transcriptional regulator [Antricoccus suffuscus]PRZ40756.1 TetR family transcriptional regulator [Antricoccus suffuscus]